MCAEHRSNVLKEIRERLDRNEKVICISTQLVEAGVDFSFQCVIRSLAGLDNLIQAAGRCNRNGGPEKGLVCLIKMSEEAERISSLKDIRMAQEAMLCTLCLLYTSTGMSQDEIQKVWEYGIITLENKLNELDKTSEIASCRQDISARCRNAAYASGNLFRLSVPTGAGKTLSLSLIHI